MTKSARPTDNGAIQTQPQSEFRLRSSEAPATGEAPHGTGWLILLWYAGLIVAALLSHWAMGAQSAVFSAALAGAAITIPLILLVHTMRSYGAVLNSHVLVPAIGPIVIAVLIVEYIEYNRHLEDAQSAQLIPAELLVLSEVKWSDGENAGGGRLSGHVVNRSPNELVGISIEMMLYGGSEQLGGAQADAALDIAPGEEGNFTVETPRLHPGRTLELPCTRAELLPPAKKQPGKLQCFFRVAGTRGETVFF